MLSLQPEFTVPFLPGMLQAGHLTKTCRRKKNSVRGNPLDALRTCYCGVRIPRSDSCYPPLAKRCSVQRDNILVDIVSFDRMKLCRFAALLPSKSDKVRDGYV